MSRRGEDGAGTVLAVAFLGLVLVVSLGAGGVVGIVATHRSAQGAADLASLAAAAALQDGGDPCVRAQQIAVRNGARLTACRVVGWEAAVTVAAPGPRLLGTSFDMPARARAGPATGASP